MRSFDPKQQKADMDELFETVSYEGEDELPLDENGMPPDPDPVAEDELADQLDDEALSGWRATAVLKWKEFDESDWDRGKGGRFQSYVGTHKEELPSGRRGSVHATSPAGGGGSSAAGRDLGDGWSSLPPEVGKDEPVSFYVSKDGIAFKPGWSAQKMPAPKVQREVGEGGVNGTYFPDRGPAVKIKRNELPSGEEADLIREAFPDANTMEFRGNRSTMPMEELPSGGGAASDAPLPDVALGPTDEWSPSNFSSVSDLEEKLHEKHPEVDFDFSQAPSMEAASELARGFDEIATSIPGGKDRLRTVLFDRSGSRSLDSRTWAVVRREKDYDDMAFNASRFRDLPDLKERIANEEAYGNQAKGATEIRHLVAHEYGHVVDNALRAKGKDKDQDDLIKRYKPTSPNLGRYADTHKDEAWAEAFSVQNNDMNLDDLSREIHHHLIKHGMKPRTASAEEPEEPEDTHDKESVRLDLLISGSNAYDTIIDLSEAYPDMRDVDMVSLDQLQAKLIDYAQNVDWTDEQQKKIDDILRRYRDMYTEVRELVARNARGDMAGKYVDHLNFLQEVKNLGMGTSL